MSLFFFPLNISSAFLRSILGISLAGSTPGLITFILFSSTPRSIAKFLVVTCDSTSMISEAALTGKPIYVAQIPPKRDDHRFRQFRDLFSKLNIIKNLNNSLEIWKYEKLDETNRIANLIKQKL